MAGPVLPLILGDGTTVWVRLGDLSPEARAHVSQILGYPGSNELAPWFSAGGPGRIADGYELLRREVNAHSRLLDGLMIGARHNAYAGNIAAVNRNRSKHTLAQHLKDPLSDAVNPIPPALEVYQSILSDALSVDGIRAVMTLGRWGNGAVTQAEAILLLEKRLTNGATDAGAWIRTTGNEFMVNSGGGIYCRGGLLVFGNSSNVILRGGHIYVEDGGVVATLGPGVISDTNPSSVTECSLAMARTSDTTAQIGDLYGIDVGTLTIQASTVRALSPDGTDSAFKAKALILETDPLPTAFTAGNRGIGWDSDDDKLKKWDGSTYTEIASVGSAGLPRGYVRGFAQVGSIASDAVTYRPGECRDKANAADIAITVDTTASLRTTNNAAGGSERRTLTGTIAVVATTTAVVGTGTAFLTEFGTPRALVNYGAGAPTISSAAAVVTGTNTKFLRDVAVNDLIGTDAKGYHRVVSIESETSLTLESAPAVAFAADTAGVIENANIVAVQGASRTASLINKITTNLALVMEQPSAFTHALATGYAGVYAEAAPKISGVNGDVYDTHLWLHLWAATGGSGTTLFWSTQRTTPFGTVTGYTTGYRRLGSYLWTGDDDLEDGGFGFLTDHQYQTSGGDGLRRCVVWGPAYTLANGSATTFTDVVCNEKAPPGAVSINVEMLMFDPTSAPRVFYLKQRGQATTTPPFRVVADATSGWWMHQVDVPCDGAQILQYKLDGVSDGAYLTVTGFTDDTTS